MQTSHAYESVKPDTTSDVHPSISVVSKAPRDFDPFSALHSCNRSETVLNAREGFSSFFFLRILHSYLYVSWILEVYIPMLLRVGDRYSKIALLV